MGRPGTRSGECRLLPEKGGTERRRSRGLVRPTVAGVGEVVLEDVGIADGVKVGVALSLLGGEALLVIVAQQLVEEVNGLVRNEALVLRCDEAVPGLLLEAAENVVVLGIELYLVLVEVFKQLVSAKDLSNLNKLVGIALAVEEGLFAENHGRKHGAEAPHVKAVVVFLEVDEQFGSLKVAGCDSDVVFGSRMVELGQTPIDETELESRISKTKHCGLPCVEGAYLAVLMINHDIVWLDITVHDAFAVTEVQGFEKLKNIVADIQVVEFGV